LSFPATACASALWPRTYSTTVVACVPGGTPARATACV